jgi:thiosulfate/3-mercaptopyruvate sulfurtransferase
MRLTTIISAAELVLHINDPEWVIVDSRFKLNHPDQGRVDYLAAHIPSAVYAHLEEDLCGPIIKGVTGRHPLPGVDKACAIFSGLGIDENIQVVAYDDMGGALAASRVWWTLRWLGHEAVAVLNGGWQQWLKEDFAIRTGNEIRARRSFIPHPRNELIVSSTEVDSIRCDPRYRLLDARSADRFRGENETIDPVPGHIPGAISAAYAGNLNPDGTFRSRKSLLDRYQRILDGVPAEKTVCYCGSGVTATHNILAMQAIGFGEARLYAGSYSEWITDPKRPVVKEDLPG